MRRPRVQFGIIKLVLALLGRSTAYRLGRALYMQARGDVANDMHSNGEFMIQERVLARGVQSRAVVCFDVGANVGDWSQALLSRAALMGRAVQLHVFEPIPPTMAEARRRIGERPDVRYEDLALSSAQGIGEMHLAGETAGTNSLHLGAAGDGAPTQSVKLVPAAEYCGLNEIRYVDLFKCDTEGHDIDVIVGAIPLLRDGAIGVFQFEYNHRWVFSGHFLKEVFDRVEGLPYLVGKVRCDHIEVYDRWHPELERFFEANFVLIGREASDWFDLRRVHFDCHNAISGAKNA